MYNFRNEDEIKRDMLKNIKNTVDKTENSIVHDALSPAAIEFQNAYVELDYVARKIDVENLEGEELETFVKQRTNTERKLATKASEIVTIDGSEDSIVREGDLVCTEDITFIIQETKQIGESGKVEVLVECEIEGSTGNVPAHTIVNFPVSLQGINSVTNKEAVTNGYDDETDNELRARYYERIRRPITSANKYHYLSWVKEVVGVGDAKVISRWNSELTSSLVKGMLDSILQNNKYTDEEVDDIVDEAMRHALSVKVIIIDSNKQTASEDLVNEVQEYIDPGTRGLGEGQAPIGAFCTVVSASEKPINIDVNITKDLNYSIEQIKTDIGEEVVAYLKTVAFRKNLVSYAHIGALILDVEGVLDYTNLTVNLDNENILVGDEEVAILGEVVTNEPTP